ncbi:MAG: hypothetical protein ACFFAN_09255 [Promethearchaeota archaeon]
MSNKKDHIDDCGCEHHTHAKNASHPKNGKCPTDLFVDNLIEALKKDFEKITEEKNSFKR